MNRIEKQQEEQEKQDSWHLDQLSKTYEYSAEQFDKSILFVSSGALGLSITFLDKLVKLESAAFLLLLAISWGAFVVTIFLFTVAHYISKQAANKAIRNYYIDQERCEKPRDRWVKYSNKTMIVTLLIGLSTLIAFILLNLKYNEQEPKPGQGPVTEQR